MKIDQDPRKRVSDALWEDMLYWLRKVGEPRSSIGNTPDGKDRSKSKSPAKKPDKSKSPSKADEPTYLFTNLQPLTTNDWNSPSQEDQSFNSLDLYQIENHLAGGIHAYLGQFLLPGQKLVAYDRL